MAAMEVRSQMDAVLSDARDIITSMRMGRLRFQLVRDSSNEAYTHLALWASA